MAYFPILSGEPLGDFMAFRKFESFLQVFFESPRMAKPADPAPWNPSLLLPKTKIWLGLRGVVMAIIIVFFYERFLFFGFPLIFLVRLS